MNKVLKILKFLTVVLFLITILSVYAFLPREVSLYIGDLQVSKEYFFYASLILFCVLNFLFSSLAWFYQRIKEENPKRQQLKDWLTSLPVPINGYLLFMIAYIGIINNPESVNPDSYAYLLYLGPVLVVIWVVAVIRILMQSKNSVVPS